MELSIISKEVIKPSSPTPHYQRTHKLSLLDQLSPDVYVPILLFYKGQQPGNTCDHLKKSLSEALTHFYPFAGQVKDDFTIDCNDHGVTFVEANINKEMSEILKQPRMVVLQELLPCKPHEKIFNVNLAVQINHFSCGGLLVCVCFNHTIADATAAANFIKCWAKIASGSDGSKDIKNAIVDCTSTFPPQELGFSRSLHDQSYDCSTVKRFSFDGTKITSLRDRFGSNPPTRYEAVSGLIWSAVIDAARETCDMHLAGIPVNLRKRMNPPFAEHCIGNIYDATAAMWKKTEGTSDYHCLVGKIHESIALMDENYVRKRVASDENVNFRRNATDHEYFKSNKVRVFGISGWCRLPFYEADFGWGKPIWATTALGLNNLAILLDTCDGEGIEAWVGLPKEEMAKFEQHPAILANAFFNPIIYI